MKLGTKLGVLQPLFRGIYCSSCVSLVAVKSVAFLAAVCIGSSNAYADIGATHTSLVSEFASFNTPGVVDGRVYAIAVDGDTVFVGGSFTEIQEPLDGEILSQPYLFAYSKSSGNIIREFDPILNSEVRAIETSGNGTGVFVGGSFNTLNGESNNRGLLKIDDSGDRIVSFASKPDRAVNTLVRIDNTLYAGGTFSAVSGTPVERLVALDTVTGAVLPDLNFDFEGRFFSDRNPNTIQGVDDIDITSDGKIMVVVGNFESIDGISRPRLAVIELGEQARVSTWNTDVFDFQCGNQIFVQYIQGIDIAPDDTYFLTATNGGRRRAQPACDSIARYEFGDLSEDDVQPTWVNYTGGDSVYEVVATDHAVYAGGHFRWLTNDAFFGSDMQGPGSLERRGLGALDPINGLTLVDWRSDRNPRGVGVFSMIAEPEGLYIGDDTDFVNGSKHAKLKFLPITSDVIRRPQRATLPTTMLSANGSALDGVSFDGTALGVPSPVADAGWSDAAGAIFVDGQLFHADTNGKLWQSRWINGVFEPREPVDLFGMTSTEWDISRVSGMFYEYQQGRVYYTLQGDSRLFWRAFTPSGPYFGNDDFIAEGQGDIPWRDISGMDVIDGHLYFGLTDGSLNRAEIDGALPITGTTEQVSGPGVDARIWGGSLLAFLSEDAQEPDADLGAEVEFESSGSQTSRRFSRFNFQVEPDEPFTLRLVWPDTNAMLRLFVRDANNQLVASDTSSAGSPKYLTIPAGDGGTYTASVLIFEGSTSYSLQVNPIEAPPPPPPPEPLADFEFSSGGSSLAGRWQVFNFDVEAGELVEAQAIWEDLSADVRVFLRDENNQQIAKKLDGNGSATLSAVAQSSGQWSVGVSINSGSTNYDVLVDTSIDFETPESLADFEFNSSGSARRGDGRFQTFRFDVVAGETIDAQVTWDKVNADVRVFLRDESGTQVDRDIEGNGLASVASVATSSGTWSTAVYIRSAVGTVTYDVRVNAD